MGGPARWRSVRSLETMRIAATGHGLRTEVTRRLDLPDETPASSSDFCSEVSALVFSGRRWQAWPQAISGLVQDAAGALACGKAHVPQRQVAIHHARGLRGPSPGDRMDGSARTASPEEAVGVDPLTRRLMRWVMQSWLRVEFFNTWLAGTLMPRLELDLIPGLACAAHFGVVAAAAPESIDDYVAAGRAMPRCWLEAARLGLWLQPEMTPVIFSRYHRQRTGYTSSGSARALGARIASGFEALLGPNQAQRVVFFARIGTGWAPWARSTRMPLSRLSRDAERT